MLSYMLKGITYKNTFCQYYNKYKICYIYVVILWTKSRLLKKGSSGEMTDTRFFHSNHGRDLKKARRFIAGNQPFTQ